jgi:hypothetical protein
MTIAEEKALLARFAKAAGARRKDPHQHGWSISRVDSRAVRFASRAKRRLRFARAFTRSLAW